MEDRFLRLRQLEEMLGNLAKLIPVRPKIGWIAEFRKAMLMTSAQLAKRLGVEQSTASRLEKSEVKNTITLESLERAAAALGCELRYVFVPTKPLEKEMFQRAMKKLRAEDQRLQHTMGLEKQADSSSQLNETIRAAFLLSELGSKIWDDE